MKKNINILIVVVVFLVGGCIDVLPLQSQESDSQQISDQVKVLQKRLSTVLKESNEREEFLQDKLQKANDAAKKIKEEKETTEDSFIKEKKDLEKDLDDIRVLLSNRENEILKLKEEIRMLREGQDASHPDIEKLKNVNEDLTKENKRLQMLSIRKESEIKEARSRIERYTMQIRKLKERSEKERLAYEEKISLLKKSKKAMEKAFRKQTGDL